MPSTGFVQLESLAVFTPQVSEVLDLISVETILVGPELSCSGKPEVEDSQECSNLQLSKVTHSTRPQPRLPQGS